MDIWEINCCICEGYSGSVEKKLTRRRCEILTGKDAVLNVDSKSAVNEIDRSEILDQGSDLTDVVSDLARKSSLRFCRT